MTEELLARWREAQDKLNRAKEALDSFQQFVVIKRSRLKLLRSFNFHALRVWIMKPLGNSLISLIF